MIAQERLCFTVRCPEKSGAAQARLYDKLVRVVEKLLISGRFRYDVRYIKKGLFESREKAWRV